jgi:hypothetical protein
MCFLEKKLAGKFIIFFVKSATGYENADRHMSGLDLQMYGFARLDSEKISRLLPG